MVDSLIDQLFEVSSELYIFLIFLGKLVGDWLKMENYEVGYKLDQI